MNKKTIIGFAISVIFLFFALRGIDWKLVFESLKQIKIVYLIPIFLIYMISYAVR
ncbi:MAG: hypothetical protein GF384_06265, partial [Elusimicrobia bacterium]|nr:hypothetical protein [Elusimicrobiota bacterium]MBD3412324.1 hypothetical protein [Elusimicrobiota bacterium]